MFERLLLCTDFSKYAIKISECVPLLPGIHEVVLLHVFDATHYHIQGWTYNPQIENAKIRLEEQKKHLEHLGLQVKVRLNVITSGDIASGIISAADEENVSLIVIGARGEGLLERTFLGSVARAVLRTMNHHTLILNESVVEDMKEGSRTVCQEILSKVIFPTDFSQHSNEALEIVKDMKGLGTLVLIHVITKGQTTREIKTLEEDTHQRLNSIVGNLSTKGIPAISHMRLGNPVDEILQCAKEEEASLILLNSHNVGWFYSLFNEGKSIKMVMNANRPVLIVRVR
jgi:nucleotide-binding universal stress UspA family protein